MSRTNIDIDDELVDRAMRMYRLESKRAAVQLALERLVGPAMTKDEVLAMEGVGFPLTNDELEGEPDDLDLSGLQPQPRRRRSAR